MKHETGICINCGASYGLHHFETRACPKNGIEETRFDELAGKFYPQQWQNTPFEDAGLRKLHNAAPELLEAIQKAIKISSLWTFGKDVTIEHEDEAKALHSMHLEFDRVIKKATE